MAADASIFSQYLQPVRSMQDYGADIDKRKLLELQLQGQQGQNALLDLTRRQQADTAQSAMEDQNAIRAAAAASGGDRSRFLSSLETTGRPGVITYAQGIRKSDADLGHVQSQTAAQNATAGKTAEENRYAMSLHHSQGLAFVNTPEAAEAYMRQGAAMGLLDNLPPEQRAQALEAGIQKMRTDGVEAWKQQAKQSAIPILEQAKIDAENSRNAATNATLITTTGMNNRTTVATNAATVGATIRAQDVTDKRERDQVEYRDDGNNNLVGMRKYAKPGDVIKAQAVTAPGPGIQPLGAGGKPNADFLKQSEALTNMSDALTLYRSKLDGFGVSDMVSPSARAEVGQAYQNALLQAKEIYKLGVLNGGDERILKGIITSPLDWTSTLVPVSAMKKQADDLQKIVQGMNSNLARVNNRQPVAIGGGATAAPSLDPSLFKITGVK